MSPLTPLQQAMLDLFQQHMQAELAGDLEGTMATMTPHPHLHNVPVRMGGVDRDGVRRLEFPPKTGQR